MNFSTPRWVLIAALVAAPLASLHSSTWAQERPDAHHPQARRAVVGNLRLDERYHHDHYYPVHGHVVTVLPPGSFGVGFQGGNYYFNGGIWFRGSGGRFIVAAPPIGIIVPLLPPAYVTLWVGSTPYYYANGVYYAPAPGQGYVTVAPPPQEATVQPIVVQPPVAVAPPAPQELILYPRNGQSAQQTQTDRGECMQWASSQPNATEPSTFQRALAACLDGRGYSSR